MSASRCTGEADCGLLLGRAGDRARPLEPAHTPSVCASDRLVDALVNPTPQTLSHTMYQLNGSRKSTPSHHRHLVELISNSKQNVDDVWG